MCRCFCRLPSLSRMFIVSYDRRWHMQRPQVHRMFGCFALTLLVSTCSSILAVHFSNRSWICIRVLPAPYASTSWVVYLLYFTTTYATGPRERQQIHCKFGCFWLTLLVPTCCSILTVYFSNRSWICISILPAFYVSTSWVVYSFILRPHMERSQLHRRFGCFALTLLVSIYYSILTVHFSNRSWICIRIYCTWVVYLLYLTTTYGTGKGHKYTAGSAVWNCGCVYRLITASWLFNF